MVAKSYSASSSVDRLLHMANAVLSGFLTTSVGLRLSFGFQNVMRKSGSPDMTMSVLESPEKLAATTSVDLTWSATGNLNVATRGTALNAPPEDSGTAAFFSSFASEYTATLDGFVAPALLSNDASSFLFGSGVTDVTLHRRALSSSCTVDSDEAVLRSAKCAPTG